MKKCPYCAEAINDDAVYCLYCRHYLNKRSRWIWLIILIPILAIAALAVVFLPDFIKLQGKLPNTPSASSQKSTATLPEGFVQNQVETPFVAATNASDDGQEQESTQSSPSVPASSGSSPLRIPPMPGVTFIADDRNTTPEINKSVAGFARNLAVPSPYTWEVFQCSMGMQYQSVKDYYTLATKPLGFQVGYDQPGQYEIYILTLLNKSQKITLQFNNDVIGIPPFFIVFYSQY